MTTKVKTKHAGADIEIDFFVKPKENGYNDEWKRDECLKPHYIDPSEFSDDVVLEID